MAYELESGRVVCEQCGNDYKRIASHWSRGECAYPELTDVQKDILIGSLMGDGTILSKHNKNQSISVSWISEDQCKWLDESLGWLSRGVSEHMSSDYLADNYGGDSSGFDCSDDPDDWSDVYRVTTMCHPFITKMTNKWYGDSGYEKKCWPEDLELTPTVLLLWFIGDGSYGGGGTNNYVTISTVSESERTDKVYTYFEDAGLPRPSWNHNGEQPCWTVHASRELFKYMLKSPLVESGLPTGFEYKFPPEHGGLGASIVYADASA